MDVPTRFLRLLRRRVVFAGAAYYQMEEAKFNMDSCKHTPSFSKWLKSESFLKSFLVVQGSTIQPRFRSHTRRADPILSEIRLLFEILITFYSLRDPPITFTYYSHINTVKSAGPPGGTEWKSRLIDFRLNPYTNSFFKRTFKYVCWLALENLVDKLWLRGKIKISRMEAILVRVAWKPFQCYFHENLIN